MQKIIPKTENSNELVLERGALDTLPSKYFGEGLAPRSATEFALLTYKERTVLIVDRATMQVVDHKTYTIPRELKEGWGMTSDKT